MIDKAIVIKAITPLEAGFVSDGIRMVLGEIEGNSVNIRLIVAPGACRECIMPIPHLEKMFQRSLQDEGIQSVQVRVTIEDESSAAVS
jgi:hypothetical protein